MLHQVTGHFPPPIEVTLTYVYKVLSKLQGSTHKHNTGSNVLYASTQIFMKYQTRMYDMHYLRMLSVAEYTVLLTDKGTNMDCWQNNTDRQTEVLREKPTPIQLR